MREGDKDSIKRIKQQGEERIGVIWACLINSQHLIRNMRKDNVGGSDTRHLKRRDAGIW